MGFRKPSQHKEALILLDVQATSVLCESESQAGTLEPAV